MKPAEPTHPKLLKFGEHLHITINKPLHARLWKLAKATSLSISTIVKLALEEYLSRREA